MEDAVEVGLRSAFNEAGFTSFGKVLPGIKLRGEHSGTSRGVRWIAYMCHSLIAGKQALWYYFTDHLHEFLEGALEWYNSHDRAEITPFLKNCGERLKSRIQVSFRFDFPWAGCTVRPALDHKP
jgi:hypothetical protein